MRFSKGTIKNINRKLITGALALTLITTGLASCSGENIVFDYSVNEQGEYEVNGNVSYERLDKCRFVVIENTSYNVMEFYICKYVAQPGSGIYSYPNYFNVFNGQRINDNSNSRKIVHSEILEDYLYATSNIKANYTVEDVEQILEEMKQNYLKQNNKQLVKG